MTSVGIYDTMYKEMKKSEQRKSAALKEQKKGKLFSFFNFNRGNELDAIAEDTTPTVRRYFKLLGRRFWKLFSLNVIMLMQVLPVLLAVYLYFSIRQTPTQADPLFSQLYGANLIHSTPSSNFLLDLFGAQIGVPVFNATASYVVIAICILFLLFTFGWQNTGATYILRSMVRGEPVFIFSDYFYAIKKNLKQSFFLGMLDFIAIFLLAYDYLFFSENLGSMINNIGFYLSLALILIYFFMRFYIYLLQITFHLSIRKILKNALIFSLIGFKRNIMGLLGILLWTALVLLMAPLLSYGIALVVVFPILFYFSFSAFSAAYAAYPIIDRYMIEPYRQATDSDAEEEGDGEDLSDNGSQIDSTH